jgi:hypothetical protein
LNASAINTYRGGCHCERVRFRLTASIDRVTSCNCSICRKKGGLFLRVDAESFTLDSGAEFLTRYSFGTGRASHWFCKVCGIQVYLNPRIAPEKFSVNVRCLDNVDIGALEVVPFDGLNWEASVAAANAEKTGGTS